AFEDAQRAVFEPGRDGGDALAGAVLAAPDQGIGAAQLLDFACARRIDGPHDVPGQVLGAIAGRFMRRVLLTEPPAYGVAILHVPDRGERIAEAEVDAADFLDALERIGLLPGVTLQGLRRIMVGAGENVRHMRRQLRHHAAAEVRIHQPRHRLERAAVFLAEPRFAQGAAFLLKEVGVDARALIRADLHTLPIVPAARPGVPE